MYRMKKRGIVLLIAVLAVACGIVFLKDLDKKNESNQGSERNSSLQSQESADGEPEAQCLLESKEAFAQKCEELIQLISEAKYAIYSQEEEIQELIVYEKMQEDGHGLIIFSWWDSDSLRDCYIVYLTSDGGSHWERSQEPFYSWGREIIDVIVLNNHIFIYNLCGSSMSMYWQEIAISHDYGASFEMEISAAQMTGIMAEGLAAPDLIRMDADKDTMVIAWKPYQWGNSEGKSFLIAEYDMNSLEMVEEMYRDTYFYRVLELEEEKGFYFEDSDQRYLTEEEILAYKEALEICEACYLFGTDYEEFLGYAINEIYYRKGYDFTGTSYEAYFAEFPGYEERECREVKEEDLNPYEKYNIDLLAELREAVKNQE